jgi:hypothetical protein
LFAKNARRSRREHISVEYDSPTPEIRGGYGKISEIECDAAFYGDCHRHRHRDVGDGRGDPRKITSDIDRFASTIRTVSQTKLIPADASLPESAAMDANTLELLDCYGARLMKELRWSEPTKMWPYCWTPYC